MTNKPVKRSPAREDARRESNEEFLAASRARSEAAGNVEAAATALLAGIKETDGAEIPREQWPLAEMLVSRGLITLGASRGPGGNWRRAVAVPDFAELEKRVLSSEEGAELGSAIHASLAEKYGSAARPAKWNCPACKHSWWNHGSTPAGERVGCALCECTGSRPASVEAELERYGATFRALNGEIEHYPPGKDDVWRTRDGKEWVFNGERGYHADTMELTTSLADHHDGVGITGRAFSPSDFGDGTLTFVRLAAVEPSYPEHEKLRAVAEQSQKCGEFFEWLGEKRYTLATYHRHDAECGSRADGWRKCGMTEDHPYPAQVNIRSLLAEFFQIDEAKLEEEKLAMLAKLRGGTRK